MGRLSTEAMLEQVDADTALRWHLQHNHYPPVPLAMLETCKTAIRLAREGTSKARVQLPAGITWRGNHEAPVWAIIEDHHLEPFMRRSF
jgi:hypothetical protein